jgi:uncharacterized protein (UPF0264 family)
LLVSVRSGAEARAALEGGATLIDVKEPDHGPLGRASDAVIGEVVAAVGARRPVSAALGELLDERGDALPAGVSFVKWGLAGYAASAAWRTALAAWRGRGPAVVAVAYADWQCARAPAVEDVLAFAAQTSGVLLLDTHCKDAAPHRPRPTLLDWLPVAEIEVLCVRCRAVGVRVALAGSLGPAEIAQLSPARPDWFAVRGAACEGGRDGVVSTRKVQALARIARLARRASEDGPR